MSCRLDMLIMILYRSKLPALYTLFDVLQIGCYHTFANHLLYECMQSGREWMSESDMGMGISTTILI
jgi:hypothetical protein